MICRSLSDSAPPTTMATPRDHSAGLAGLVPASHLLLASLPGYLSAGLATARGRPRVSETWSDQPPACLASFARGLAPASHLLLASLTGYLSAGLATARGRPRISETWSNQPPACFASFARVPTSLLRICCSRPHNVGPAGRPCASVSASRTSILTRQCFQRCLELWSSGGHK